MVATLGNSWESISDVGKDGKVSCSFYSDCACSRPMTDTSLRRPADDPAACSTVSADGMSATAAVKTAAAVEASVKFTEGGSRVEGSPSRRHGAEGWTDRSE